MTKKNTIEILFTDLDGTLLNSDRTISTANLDCLERLGSRNIIRVISTGRSLFSFRKIFGDSPPADYLVFSNGAGILDLQGDSLLSFEALEHEDIELIASHLTQHQADFMIHHTVPENHRFTYFRNQRNNPDFNRRIDLYQDYATEHNEQQRDIERSAQIIAILPNDIDRFIRIKQGLNGYQVTRTTSPLDQSSIWMEIYPRSVSKGKSAEWLCSHLHISSSRSLAIGNDYNDISLLDFAGTSFVVANAPAEMQSDYLVTASNDDDGFSQAVSSAIIF